MQSIEQSLCPYIVSIPFVFVSLSIFLCLSLCIVNALSLEVLVKGA